VLTAFALGVAAFGAVAVVGALAVSALADASGRSELTLAVAGLELLEFERTESGTTSAFGPALALLPVAGGLANAGAAWLLHIVSRRSS